MGDGAARRCASTAECLADEFCQLDQICRQREGRTAVCLPRPSACPEIYAPVCGCDGTTYGSACEAHSAGVSVATDGPCNQQPCAGLDRSYQAAVQEAKVCCAQCKSIQCTLKVKTELACPCQTYVDLSNSGPLETMDSLEQQWNALQCGPQPCPAIACPDPRGATCMPTSGGSGVCQDLQM